LNLFKIIINYFEGHCLFVLENNFRKNLRGKRKLIIKLNWLALTLAFVKLEGLLLNNFKIELEKQLNNLFSSPKLIRLKFAILKNKLSNFCIKYYR
jgi:hypothetical protein